MIDTPVKPFAADAANLADRAADGATQAIRSTQGVANAAFERLNEKVEATRDRAVPIVDRLANQADIARQRSLDALRDTAAQVRDTATRVQDTTVSYVKNEPVKAILIAAATGAALMALIGMMNRSRSD